MSPKSPIFQTKLAILAMGALLLTGCAFITVRDEADDEHAVQTAPQEHAMSAVQTAAWAPAASAVD